MALTAAGAQSLDPHRWNNRLLILVDTSDDQLKLGRQLDQLRTEATGLRDRKLVVYQFNNEAYRTGLDVAADWTPGTLPATLTNRIKNDGSFQLFLIGLDGGVKLHRDDVTRPETIFSLIDGMPMRRAELRRRSDYD